MIKSRLCHKSVLIVLDDVDHIDHLNALAGSHDWFGQGSRIIITTRDSHILNAQKVNVIHHISGRILKNTLEFGGRKTFKTYVLWPDAATIIFHQGIELCFLMLYESLQKELWKGFKIACMQFLCGRLTRVTKYKDNHEFLINLVNIHWGRKTLDEIVYSDLQKQINPASLLTFSAIAYQCLRSGNERPTMKKVVEQLQKALATQLVIHIDCFYINSKQLNRSLASSSSQSSWNYDVYLSFIESYSRINFVDHLNWALVKRQILTYKGDEFRGKSINPSHAKAIQESRIAIIIFSPYASYHSYFLDELAFIMKNKYERGQIVIPIFHNIKPSELRLEEEHYEHALARHNLEKNNKVGSWREALLEAAKLPGLDVAAYWQEPKCIPTIVDHISHQLLSFMPRPKARAETNSDTYLIGIEKRVQELKSVLKFGSGGVHIVGIYGMWGSGKSTLASSIYDEISHEFEGCCFVKNVIAKSRMHGLKTLQEEILSNVLKSEVTLGSIEQGISMMEKRLRQNGVLIVLDNVDHVDHLEMLVGSHDWFGDGSRIIFTTRNQDLVNARNVPTHNVRMLDDIEAIELLSRHAFGKSKPAQGFEELSQSIVSKLGGHPLALIRMGSFLHGKDMSEWMSILDGLVARTVDEILKKFETPDDGVVRNISAETFTFPDGLGKPYWFLSVVKKCFGF
ncbi:hypothetical protein QVD17_31775 [Tagetes erecta]|uniref:TIR domain-containing protein n=1 Tax=Tagetes erecta TaxID=13708 RepID=A0AAD8K4F3_TARER|nr:hypothetical protein QVD17_31775 [Tagetes erecta]